MKPSAFNLLYESYASELLKSSELGLILSWIIFYQEVIKHFLIIKFINSLLLSCNDALTFFIGILTNESFCVFN